MVTVIDVALTLNRPSFKCMNFWNIEVYAQKLLTSPSNVHVFPESH